MRFWKNRNPTHICIAIIIGTGIFLLGFITHYNRHFYQRQVLATSAAATVAVMALLTTVLIAWISDKRTKTTNAFALTAAWDKEPMLEARNTIRYISNDSLLERAIREHEKEVHLALIHFINFFWNMAAAVQTGWTDSDFLQIRFAPTLKRYYPAIKALTSSSPDPSGEAMIQNLEALGKRWELGLETLQTTSLPSTPKPKAGAADAPVDSL